MTPLYFGSPQRRLFGVYSPASASARRPRAMLLCPPWGQEYLRSHRSMRQLALRLNEAGFHVLRFDYHGTGDSAGDMEDAELPGWQSDIDAAIDELIDMTGAQRIGIAGLRLGATLAAAAAARRRRQVDTAVLWDPVVSGARFVDELIALDAAEYGHAAPLPRPHGRPGWQVLGFALSPALREQIAATDLLPLLPALPARTLVITSANGGANALLHEQIAARGEGGPAFEHIASQPAWLEHRSSGAGAVPVALLERIVGWCAA